MMLNLKMGFADFRETGLARRVEKRRRRRKIAVPGQFLRVMKTVIRGECVYTELSG
jgi:hypothetical protein